ncbi:MAG: sugar kinase [Pirellulales bacterium]|nr:sugar kinase [Pirellulales bacterium]
MSLLVVGSIALDTVETPSDRRDDLVGGSAVHFACAASFFTPVRLVGVVGEDWPDQHTALLNSHRVDTAGLTTIAGGETFRWSGRYESNMNHRETMETHLNVFEFFDPILPDNYRDSQYVFLANGLPRLQGKVLDQIPNVRLAVADTMDFWIHNNHDELMELLTRLDGLVINDSEAVLLTGMTNLVAAGRRVCQMGPKFVIIKKGEHGAMFLTLDDISALPAFPTETVTDPTGAGDSFAGGMMGYLADQDNIESETLKTAMAYGILVASFNVEGFGLERLLEINRHDIEDRMQSYRGIVTF